MFLWANCAVFSSCLSQLLWKAYHGLCFFSPSPKTPDHVLINRGCQRNLQALLIYPTHAGATNSLSLSLSHTHTHTHTHIHTLATANSHARHHFLPWLSFHRPIAQPSPALRQTRCDTAPARQPKERARNREGER